jgi:hypothetical protein
MKRIGAELPCGTSWRYSASLPPPTRLRRRSEPLVLLDADRPVLPVKP